MTGLLSKKMPAFALLIPFAVLCATGAARAQPDSMLPPGFSAEVAEDGQQEALPAAEQQGGFRNSLGLPEGLGAETGEGQQAEIPKSPQEIENEVREESFNAAVSGLLPLRPEEIRKLLDIYDKTQQAVQTPIYPQPTPEISVQTVSLDPGVLPPVIKLATGHVTTLSILDVSGAPWPIQDVSWAGNFEIIEPETGGHIIRITPLSEFAYGNISMRLVSLKTPVTFTLQTHRDAVQYRFDARIPEFGPFANAPLIEGGSSTMAVTGDKDIVSILDGTPPDKAVKLKVSGADGRTTAYKFSGKTYVRTPFTLLSPGWQTSVSSADGMHVYALANTPVVLLSDEGRVVRAHLKQGGKDD